MQNGLGGTAAKDIMLIIAFFDYVANSIAQQDLQSVQRLGLRPDQLKRIETMTLSDRMNLAPLCLEFHCLRVAIDGSALDELFDCFDEHKEARILLTDCIISDAPRAMASYFFGLSKTKYAVLRQQHGMPNFSGRVRQAEPREADVIHERLDDVATPTAQSLLEIAQQLGVSLRIVWDEAVPRLPNAAKHEVEEDTRLLWEGELRDTPGDKDSSFGFAAA